MNQKEPDIASRAQKESTKRRGPDQAGVRGKGFMRVKEAQRFLSLSETTLYRMISRGRLTAFKVGRRTLLSRVELENLAIARESE